MDGTASRFAYCKHGDAVEELTAVGPDPTEVPDAGPRHYVSSFLAFAKGNPALLLSLSPRDAYLRRGPVRARAIRYDTAPGRPLRSAWLQVRAFLVILAQLVWFRPTRILCAAAGGPPLWACYLVARLYRIPLVCTRHTSMALRGYSLLRRWRRALNAHVVRHSRSVMCHGPYLEDELLRAGVERERLFQFNLSYAGLLRAGHLDAGLPLGSGDAAPFMVLYVGRIGWEKGVFDLFDAMLPLLEERPELRLVYAGGGRDFDALARRVAKGRLRERVLLLGAVEHQRLPALLHSSRVVVTPTHSSSTESRCKVAIEALVAGRPVVAPNFGPFPYAINSGINGLLYYPDSVPDLRNKLRHIVEDPALLERLTIGAKESGCDYLTTPVSFTEALRRAFSLPGPRATV